MQHNMLQYSFEILVDQRILKKENHPSPPKKINKKPNKNPTKKNTRNSPLDSGKLNGASY